MSQRYYFRTDIARLVDRDPRTIDSRYSDLAHGVVKIHGKEFLLFSEGAINEIRRREGKFVAQN